MSDRRSSTAHPHRRTLMVGAVAGLAAALGACRGDGRSPGVRRSDPASTIGPGGTADTSAATPASWVPPALSVVLDHRELVEAARSRHRALGQRLAPLASVVSTHESFLRGLPTPNTATPPAAVSDLPQGRTAVEKVVRSSTLGLARDLRTQAQRVSDGAGARALASMAAALAQRAVALEWSTPAPTVELSASTEAGAQEVAALQQTLAREHASLWWYGVLGAHTSQADQSDLFAVVAVGYNTHRAQRDELDRVIRQLGGRPAPAEPAYPARWRLSSAGDIRAAVGDIEHDCAATYSWLVSQARGIIREWAIAALQKAAIRELADQGIPENFPGADELADR
ncbi:MAG: DUF4439 domain-containing protein [Nocardioides sp.]